MMRNLCAVFLAASAAGPAIAQDLASGDPQAGERLFRQCRACHTIEEGGPIRTGPNLHGIVGAPVAAADGYRYSDALRAFGGRWDADRLAAFIGDPRGTVPGTKMTYRGLKDPADRADMIAYLASQSEDALPHGGAGLAPDPAGESAAGGSTATEAMKDAGTGLSGSGATKAGAAAGGDDLGQLVPGAGAQLTYDVCTACHSEMIVAQQGKTRNGWDDMLVWMVEEQGMAELPQRDREIVLDYLAEHYNTDRPNFPRP